MANLTTYTITYAGGHREQFAADLTRAEANLYTVDDEGERAVTQYQTADARHRASEAAELIAALDPDYDEDDPECEIVSVEAANS